MFESEVLKLLKKEVKEEIVLEVPPENFGDYAFACFPLAKQLRKSPAQIAEDFARKLKPSGIVEKIEAKGPYVNFFLNKKMMAEILLKKILDEKDSFGSENLGNGKTIVLDYSSPNIGKPFHFGHLRSTVIGNSIYLLHKFFGFKVIRVNHLGDWGTQFGQLIYAHEKWGSKEKLAKEPIKYLLDIYVKFHKEAEKNPELEEEGRKWFKKLEEKDIEAIKLWSKFKHLSLDEFRRIYELMGIEFDSYDGESFYNDKIESAVDKVEARKVTELSEGALVVQIDEGQPPLMLRKSDGTSTYAARDFSAVLYRLETYKPERIIYVVGTEQTLHFKQLFTLAEKMGFKPEKFAHVNFGLYLSKEGGKMATRKGETVILEDVLQESINKVLETVKKKNPDLKNKDAVAKTVGIGAVVFGDLVNDRIKDVVFDWERMLDFEGDTAPYLQYTYARISSIIRKCKEQKIQASANADCSHFKEDSELRLINLLSKFHGNCHDALQQHKPHIIAQYLLTLGRAFNEFYHKCPVLAAQSAECRKARLLLCQCTRQVIKTGLYLLGIGVVEEM